MAKCSSVTLTKTSLGKCRGLIVFQKVGRTEGEVQDNFRGQGLGPSSKKPQNADSKLPFTFLQLISNLFNLKDEVLFRLWSSFKNIKVSFYVPVYWLNQGKFVFGFACQAHASSVWLAHVGARVGGYLQEGLCSPALPLPPFLPPPRIFNIMTKYALHNIDHFNTF